MACFEIRFDNDILEVRLLKQCDFSLPKKERLSLQNAVSLASYIRVDFAKVSKVDFVFCAFLKELLQGKQYEFVHTNIEINEIFATLDMSLSLESPVSSSAFSIFSFSSVFLLFGRYASDFFQSFLNFMYFCGMCLSYFFRSILHPKYIKISSILYHMNQAGFKALPVALLTAFIVSYAIALQGVLQLERMGVPIMSVEIVAKLSLREMGPFILAIVIAGRSSSAFSAQLGVMNLTEETDALKTMNLSVFDYLVLPRVLALVIAMPLLVFLADAVSLFAAMLAVKIQTGINFTQYLERFYEYVGINNFWVGVIKAPFFGAAIALVGCFRGLYVKGDTESVGIATTMSVVNAIFWVILINAIFSIINTRLDV